MPRKNLLACFRSPITSEAIDADAGILRGVKVLQKGKLAVFAGKDGKPKSVMIDDRHINALLKYADNRGVPSHWTHDYHGKGDTAELDSRIAALFQIRKDDDGSLITDYAVKPGKHRDDVLFFAEHNPEGAMLSVVFEYDANDKDCIPLSFDAADLVPRGAGVTALFADASTQTQPMPITIEDLKALLADPEAKAILQGALDGHTDAQDAADDDTAAAEMESAAGVTDADKKGEDDKKPALMRAHLRCARAFKRQSTATAAMSDATKAEIATVAKAAVVGEIGKGEFLAQITGAHSKSKEPAMVARLSKLMSADLTQGRAIAMARQVAPSAEIAEWEAAGRPMPKRVA